MKKRIHLFISGRVQGVNFRWFARHFARKHDITGWVKNLDDGRVELVAEGDKNQLEAFVEYLKNGQPFAKVEKIEFKKDDLIENFESFDIIF